MAGSSSAGDVPGFPSPGVCGCDVPVVVVAEELSCLHPPLGEVWRSYSEQEGAEVGVELLGLFGRAAVQCAPKASDAQPPACLAVV